MESIIKGIRTQTSTVKGGVVVIDAGIATDENLRMLVENGFDYVCVSRSKLKNYSIDPSCEAIGGTRQKEAENQAAKGRKRTTQRLLSQLTPFYVL